MDATVEIGLACSVALLTGCNVGPGDESIVSGGVTDTAPAGQDTDGSDSADHGDDGDDDDDGGSGGFPDDDGDSGGPVDPVDPAAVCEVPADGLDAPGPCVEEEAELATEFAPQVQWANDLSGCVTYQEGAGGELVVANLTDDNDDGVIDQCDVPDVAFACYRSGEGGVSLFIVDGATGAVKLEHERLNEPHEFGGTYHYHPTVAAADVDGDGAAELVWAHYTQTSTEQDDGELHLVVEAIRGDGTQLWSREIDNTHHYWGLGISSADLTGDGSPMLLVGHRVLNAEGELLWTLADEGDYWYHGGEPVIVDLDADGNSEIVWGRRVYEHDGAVRFEMPDLGYDDPYLWGWDVAVADLDEDGTPELLVDNRGHYNDGGEYGEHMVHVISPDGEVTASAVIEDDDHWFDYYGWEYGGRNGGLAIADLDGDGDVEAVVATGHMGVSIVDLEGDILTEVDQFEHPAAPDAVVEQGWYYGHGAVTAFDFLGTGQSQIVRTGLGGVAVFSLDGELLFEHEVEASPEPYYYGWGHDSIAVADVDNDGAAEIIARTGADDYSGLDHGEPELVVLEDPGNGWVGARRIWNQTAYHVSHVREDGGVPVAAAPSWQTHNTFRVQSTQAPSSCGGSATPEG